MTKPEFGCFCDIAQQDGKLVRMFYPMDQHRLVKYIGITENDAYAFRGAQETESL